PGPLAHVNVVGAHLWGRTRRKLLPIYQVAGLDPELIQESRQNLISHFQSKGYFDVGVQSDIQKAQNGQTIIFRVTKGSKHKVTESTLAPAGLKVTEGQPYSTKRVDEDRSQIMAQYLRLGYLNANFRATAHAIGKDSHRLEVTYNISEGPKVTTASVVTLGAKVTRQSLINKTVQLKTE